MNRLKSFLASTILSKRNWPRASGKSHCSSLEQNMDEFKTLKELGYAFNAKGELRKTDANGQPTDIPYDYGVSSTYQECQLHYEQLGIAITEYIYDLLETEFNFTKLKVPKQAYRGTFIFASNGYENKDALVILIHGSGAVRAGQWARSLIINDNFDMGSQIPYVKCALSRDYGVLILNPNDNNLRNGQEIPQSGSGEEHISYVWNTYVKSTKAKSIAIIAHSYGGLLTVMLAKELKDEFESRVKAIALTDSVHVYSKFKVTDYLKKVGRNWMSSTWPVDTPVTTPDFDMTRVSAGHEKHEMTSYSCMESVFKFIDEKFSEN